MLCDWLFITGDTITGEKHTFFLWSFNNLCCFDFLRVLISAESIATAPPWAADSGNWFTFQVPPSQCFQWGILQTFYSLPSTSFYSFPLQISGGRAQFYSLNVNLLIDWAETKIKCSWDKEYIIMIEFESLHFLFLISQILILFLFFSSHFHRFLIEWVLRR